MLTLGKARYLSFFLKLILFGSLSNNLWGSDILLFLELEFLEKGIHFCIILLIEYVLLLYTVLVISFARYKKYMICLISFSKLSDVLPIFTCARTIGNFSSIYLGVSILKLEWSENLYLYFCCGNILLLRTLSLSSKNITYVFKNIFFLLFFLCIFFGFTCFLKFEISTNKSL